MIIINHVLNFKGLNALRRGFALDRVRLGKQCGLHCAFRVVTRTLYLARNSSRQLWLNERERLETTIVRDALELTLAIERRGYTFYTNASRKTKNGRGRLMFQRLAAEESDHLRRLQGEHQSLLEKNDWLKREPSRLPLSRKIVEEIFPQKELLKIEVKDQTSDIDALNIAMNLERRSHQFFVDFAKEISDANGRKIFMDFANDEESHLQALLTEYNTLMRTESRG